MKVKELKEILNQFDDELDIRQEYDGYLHDIFTIEKDTEINFYKNHRRQESRWTNKEILIIY